VKAAARSLVWAVAIRPWCWPVAVTQILRLARPGWWHRWPPVPLPDAALWKFRMETAYGGTGEAEPEVEDMRSFLHWSRDMRQWRRR
jgi:hypothetical protein